MVATSPTVYTVPATSVSPGSTTTTGLPGSTRLRRFASRSTVTTWVVPVTPRTVPLAGAADRGGVLGHPNRAGQEHDVALGHDARCGPGPATPASL